MNCKVMGIVNVTPDSFSDGGQFFKPEEAIRRVKNLFAEGADVVDLGAESTRPGATPLPWEEEWARLEPVLAGLKPVLAGLADGRGTRDVRQRQIALSVDTYHPETAERALQAGVKIINCVYAEPVAEMARICEQHNAELVVPATAIDVVRGRETRDAGREPSTPNAQPSTLNAQPSTPNPRQTLWLDPMIGFGTSREEDIERLRAIPGLARQGRVLVGVSRKRIVRRLSGEHGVGKLLGGSVALAVWCAAHGASMVRVHDVRETVEALTAWSALDEDFRNPCAGGANSRPSRRRPGHTC